MTTNTESVLPFNVDIGTLEPLWKEALARLDDNRVMERIRSFDHTVWKPTPDDITNRLGWVTIFEQMMGTVDKITNFVENLRQEGVTHALLMGMGGSSLAPEVFRKTFGVARGFPDLAVLDSTDPRIIGKVAACLDPAKTVFIVSTKSGGTVETLSFFKTFYNLTLAALGPKRAGAHFIAITDPGSRLETMGRELGFGNIFLNDATIGGRYSALSYFGLVPAALVGINLNRLLDRAVAMAKPQRLAGRQLGVLIATAAQAGRDKLTLILSPAISSMGAWIEQLIAESTGKEGQGVLPVDGEDLLPSNTYGTDRLFVYLRLKGDKTQEDRVNELKQGGHPLVTIDLTDRYDLGGEFFRWEMATAVAGHLLAINPFNQPNVESAKVSARAMLAAYKENGQLPEPEPTLVDNGLTVYADMDAATIDELFYRFLNGANKNSDSTTAPYLAIQAYLTPSDDMDNALNALRTAILVRFLWATTVGYGPRFLHSTGQLHKGDGGMGIFIQLTDDIASDSLKTPGDIAIPDRVGDSASSISFGTLLAAQAMGDRQALIDADRRVIRVHLGNDPIGGLHRITEIIKAMVD